MNEDNPVIEQTPVEPVVAAPVTEAAPVETPAPAVETVPTVETPAVAEEAPKAETVLGEALEKDKQAAIEAPVTEAPKAEETNTPAVEAEAPKPEGQSDEPAPPPVYDTWTLPEGITLDEELSKEFTNILGEFEGKTKADHAAVQEFGQKAVDFYIAEQKKYAEKLTEYLNTSWEKQKIDWKDQFLNDPVIGGNRYETTLDAARTFIRTHGGSPEEQAEFKNLMETSGLGNHPVMIRLLANAGRAFKEGEPLAAQRPASTPKSRISTMYGNKN